MKQKVRVVVPVDHLPARLPFGQTLLAMIALDHYHAPELARGVVWALIVLMWVGFACIFAIQRQTPLPGYGEREVTP